MHPLTVYEIAAREHERATAPHTREQSLAHRTVARPTTRRTRRPSVRTARPDTTPSTTTAGTSASDGRSAVV